MRDGGEDVSGSLLDVVGGEAEDADALGREPVGPALVVLLPVVVRGAIDFDGEFGRRTIEIEDVGTDGVLAAEMEAEFVPPQHRPERALWLGEGPAHCSGALADEIG